MAEGSLNEVNGRAAVERVAGMGVAHPVGRDFLFESGLLGRGVDDTAELGDVEVTAAFAAWEDGIEGPGGTAEGKQELPGFWLEQNGAGLAALAEDGNLAALAA
jgi:hypothetical protein